MSVSTRKTAIIDISAYFKIATTDKDEIERNTLFSQYITEQNKFSNPLKLAVANETNEGFKAELLQSIKNIIYNHLDDTIKLANSYFNIGGNNKIFLNWKKLKYFDIYKNITALLKGLIAFSPDFQKFISTATSIPDNMSVADAKSYTCRLFLKDRDLISDDKNTLKIGPIHLIGVYGGATTVQVKNLVGFPDISAIKDDFGIYVWEQNTHVQLIFLTDCKTHEAVKSKFLLFNNWSRSLGEYNNILIRAAARYHILQSINEARVIADGRNENVQ
jgi:hypothetical protein